MNFLTHRIEDLPASWGSWDRMVQSARRQNAENEQAEADLATRRAWFRADLQKLIDRGDMGAFVLSGARRHGGRAPTVHEVLTDAIAENRSLQRMVNLNTFYGEGECTKDLRRLIVEVAAENEIGE